MQQFSLVKEWVILTKFSAHHFYMVRASSTFFTLAKYHKWFYNKLGLSLVPNILCSFSELFQIIIMFFFSALNLIPKSLTFFDIRNHTFTSYSIWLWKLIFLMKFNQSLPKFGTSYSIGKSQSFSSVHRSFTKVFQSCLLIFISPFIFLLYRGFFCSFLLCQPFSMSNNLQYFSNYQCVYLCWETICSISVYCYPSHLCNVLFYLFLHSINIFVSLCPIYSLFYFLIFST